MVLPRNARFSPLFSSSTSSKKVVVCSASPEKVEDVDRPISLGTMELSETVDLKKLDSYLYQVWQ